MEVELFLGAVLGSVERFSYLRIRRRVVVAIDRDGHSPPHSLKVALILESAATGDEHERHDIVITGNRLSPINLDAEDEQDSPTEKGEDSEETRITGKESEQKDNDDKPTVERDPVDSCRGRSREMQTLGARPRTLSAGSTSSTLSNATTVASVAMAPGLVNRGGRTRASTAQRVVECIDPRERIRRERASDSALERSGAQSARSRKKGAPRGFQKFLINFSLLRNCRSFLRTRPDNQFACIDCLRVLSMCQVVWGHMYIYLLGTVSMANQEAFVPPYGIFNTVSFQFVPACLYGVDSFFVMSGFLCGNGVLNKVLKEKKRPGQAAGADGGGSDAAEGRRPPRNATKKACLKTLFVYPKFFFMRWVRLLPTEMFVILVAW